MKMIKRAVGLSLGLVLCLSCLEAAQDQDQNAYPNTPQQGMNNHSSYQNPYPQPPQGAPMPPSPAGNAYPGSQGEDWDSFDAMAQNMSQWPSKFERVFKDSLRHTMQGAMQPGSGGEFANYPPTDIAENNTEYKIAMDLPGYKKEDIKVEIKDQILYVSGVKSSATEEKKGDEEGYQYHVRERSSGSFQRSMRLPDNLATDKISAEHKDGILTIKIPKLNPGKSNVIQVNVQ